MDLISHLSVVCAMPNSLSTARVAVNAVWTMLGLLPASEREQLLVPTLPALARMCRAFPPLIEDCIQLLAQAATIWISAQSVTQYHEPGYCLDQAENAGGSAGHSLPRRLLILLITFCQRLSWLTEYPEQWVCGWLGSIFLIFKLRLGASRTRSVGWSVCWLVGMSVLLGY